VKKKIDTFSLTILDRFFKVIYFDAVFLQT